MTTLQTLKAAREKITDPLRWTQGTWARDVQGWPVERDGDAACWCAWGAVTSVKAGVGAELAACDELHKSAGGSFIAFNDTHTHAEVLALFDKAIATL